MWEMSIKGRGGPCRSASRVLLSPRAAAQGTVYNGSPGTALESQALHFSERTPFPPGVGPQAPGTSWPWPELASVPFSPSYQHPCLLYIPPFPSCWPRARPSSGPGRFHLGNCPDFTGIKLPPQLLPAWQTEGPFCGANITLTSPGPNPTITSFKANLNSQAQWISLPEPGLAGPPAWSRTRGCSGLPSMPGSQLCRAFAHAGPPPGTPCPRPLTPLPAQVLLIFVDCVVASLAFPQPFGPSSQLHSSCACLDREPWMQGP